MEKTKEEISKLESKANSFKQIEHFFNTNKSIQKYYKETIDECIRDNCYGVSTMMVLTIEKLLERIEDLEDNNDLLENEIVFLQEQIEQ